MLNHDNWKLVQHVLHHEPKEWNGKAQIGINEGHSNKLNKALNI